MMTRSACTVGGASSAGIRWRCEGGDDDQVSVHSRRCVVGGNKMAV